MSLFRNGLPFVFLFCLSALAVAAQPPPPPPPLIWEPPAATDLSEFSDTQSGFKVVFPGVPKKETVQSGELTNITAKLYRKGSNTSVAILRFPESIEVKKALIFESYKNHLGDLLERQDRPAAGRSIEILFDRKLKIGGIEGREIGFSSGFHFVHFAVFARGNVLFELKSDVTNWHILSKHKPERAAEFTSEASRFINSVQFF